MSKWDDFVQGLGAFADKTVNKTRELTDTASLKIKIANKESERDTEYKRLGKLAYLKLRKLRGYDSEQTTKTISDIMDKLDIITAELEALKAADRARKEAREAEKSAEKQLRTKIETKPAEKATSPAKEEPKNTDRTKATSPVELAPEPDTVTPTEFEGVVPPTETSAEEKLNLDAISGIDGEDTGK